MCSFTCLLTVSQPRLKTTGSQGPRLFCLQYCTGILHWVWPISIHWLSEYTSFAVSHVKVNLEHLAFYCIPEINMIQAVQRKCFHPFLPLIGWQDSLDSQVLVPIQRALLLLFIRYWEQSRRTAWCLVFFGMSDSEQMGWVASRMIQTFSDVPGDNQEWSGGWQCYNIENIHGLRQFSQLNLRKHKKDMTLNTSV